MAKDIEAILKIPNLHYKGASSIFRDVEVQTIQADYGRGVRKAKVLTLRGLYKALYISNTPLAHRFQDFVFVVLERLIETGKASLPEASVDLAKQEALDRKLRIEMEENERQHAIIKELTSKLERHESKEFYQLLAQPAHHPSPSAPPDKDMQSLYALIKIYGKPVHVMLMTPPAEYKDEYPYDINEVPSPTDAGYIYGIQLSKDSKTRSHMATVYVHPKQSLEVLHEEYSRMFLMLTKRKEPSSKYVNMYAAPLDELVKAAHDLFMKSLEEVEVSASFEYQSLLEM